MALKNIVVSTKTPEYRLPFNKETWWISDLYGRNLPPIRIGSIKKIIINIKSNVNDKLEDIKELIDILIIEDYLDLEYYFTLNDVLKKRILLDVIDRNLGLIFKTYKLEDRQLGLTYDCILKNNIRNRFLLKNKYFVSPNKRYYVALMCEWSLNKFELNALFLNKKKNKLLYKTMLFRCEPHMVDEFGSVSWLDDHTICVKTRRPDREWNARIPLAPSH